jgi:hypothetical protein
MVGKSYDAVGGVIVDDSNADIEEDLNIRKYQKISHQPIGLEQVIVLLFD